MVRKLLNTAFIMAALSIIANTAVAEVVKTDQTQRGGFCVSTSFRGADSQFNCEYLGTVTIHQIYEKGWRVVHRQDTRNTAAVVELIIEEQRK